MCLCFYLCVFYIYHLHWKDSTLNHWEFDILWWFFVVVFLWGRKVCNDRLNHYPTYTILNCARVTSSYINSVGNKGRSAVRTCLLVLSQLLPVSSRLPTTILTNQKVQCTSRLRPFLYISISFVYWWLLQQM